ASGSTIGEPSRVDVLVAEQRQLDAVVAQGSLRSRHQAVTVKFGVIFEKCRLEILGPLAMAKLRLFLWIAERANSAMVVEEVLRVIGLARGREVRDRMSQPG